MTNETKFSDAETRYSDNDVEMTARLLEDLCDAPNSAKVVRSLLAERKAAREAHAISNEKLLDGCLIAMQTTQYKEALQMHAGHLARLTADSQLFVHLDDKHLEGVANQIAASSTPDDPKLEVAYAIARYLGLDWPSAHVGREVTDAIELPWCGNGRIMAPRNNGDYQHGFDKEDMEEYAIEAVKMDREKYAHSLPVDAEMARDAGLWRFLVCENNKGMHGKFRICWIEYGKNGYTTTDGVSVDGKDEQAIVNIVQRAMKESSGG